MGGRQKVTATSMVGKVPIPQNILLQRPLVFAMGPLLRTKMFHPTWLTNVCINQS